MTPSPSDWLDALEAELDVLATTALGLPKVRQVGRTAAPPTGMEGAYLGLVSGVGPVQVGLASSSAGCQGFARGLMAMDAAAPPLPAADVADAVCEIVNMLSGGVQRRVRQKFGLEVQLGLPTFFHGHVQPTERLGVAVGEVRVGDVPAAVLVLHPRTRTTEGT
ncbi:MAG TPA: chemotaxis protein CheX [Anaeromyxobacteraceae bacterium]|nr:chemotaxis protein CheX [Anaeromyxobacteraceae bacterium]